MTRKRMQKKYHRYFWKKRCFIFVFLLAAFSSSLYFSHHDIDQGQRFEVDFDKAVDGDTAWFMIDGESVKVRFLYIDTPESTNQVEPYGQEASAFTAAQLQQAEKIELETNGDGEQYDHYDRLLAWVFVDDELLQEKIAEMGYCEKFYDYGYDYPYKEMIIAANEQAMKEKRGIYSK